MRRLWAVLLVVVPVSPALALDPNATDLFVRVADSGPALCCVVKIPPGDGETKAHYVIYDAGNYTDRGECAFEKIKEIVPAGSDVDLMVLSHSDSDHLGAVGEICDAYKVKRVLRSGYQRTSSTWKDANDAVRASAKLKGCIDINLRLCEFPAGATYRMGNAIAQMVCGFHKPPASWGALSDAKEKNAGSIVIRLTYGGKAIMFAGDAVGRNEGDPNDAAPIATEKFMLANKDVIRLDSDVLIAPHHGADNASSAAFIAAVKPTYVIFSAGHKYSHPTRRAAGRYLAAGVRKANMFCTDLMEARSTCGMVWLAERHRASAQRLRDQFLSRAVHHYSRRSRPAAPAHTHLHPAGPRPSSRCHSNAMGTSCLSRYGLSLHTGKSTLLGTRRGLRSVGHPAGIPGHDLSATEVTGSRAYTGQHHEHHFPDSPVIGIAGALIAAPHRPMAPLVKQTLPRRFRGPLNPFAPRGTLTNPDDPGNIL